MKLSSAWLNEYVCTPDNTAQLVEVLTMVGIEVEGTTVISVPEKTVVCEILEANPHPNADKLIVCKVFDGKNSLQIVCGAPNARAGLKTALAPIGTVFSDPATGKSFTIEERPLRGVISQGMMCSAKELGLSNEADGIIEFPNEFKVGEPLSNYFPKDIILTLEITPNRPDLYSHFGIAREIGAIFSTKVKLPKIPVLKATQNSNFANIAKIDDYELCPFYTARVIHDVKIAPSPAWLKKRLENIGLRAINNVVDITNFVLHELGQPLHAFDLDLLAGGSVNVRKAREGEQMLMLDGTTVKLRNSQLVIADAEKPVALAGVMGGKHSGVTDKTTRILLESAYFKPSGIRKASKETGLSTDSSYRFERGVDPEMVEFASDRAAALIAEIAGGKIASELIRCGQKPPLPPTFPCRHEKVRELLGLEISDREMISIYKRLGLGVEKAKGFCRISPPSYRADLKNEADMAEEVVRIYGIDKIPAPPVRAESSGSIRDDSYYAIETARAQLVSLGLNEAVNYSLMNEKSALLDKNFQKSDLIELSNPINRDFAFLRPSLLPSMIKVIEHNVSRKNDDFAIFELGYAYCANEAKFQEERLEVCIVASGRRHPERFSEEKKLLSDFAEIKGIVEAWFEIRKISSVSFKPAKNANFAENYCAEVFVNGRKCGTLGKLSPSLLTDIRLKHDVFAACLEIDAIISETPSRLVFKPLSQFPAVQRDMAFIAGPDFRHQDFIDFISNLKVKYLDSVEIFDEFKDERLGSGKKSLAYSFIYRHNERTLTDDEVNQIHNSLREKLSAELKIELR